MWLIQVIMAQVDWWEKVYSYTERGDDPSFWAEPLNAWTNLGFWVAAAVFAAYLLGSSKPSHHSAEDLVAGPAVRRDLWVLNALLVCIGAGSFVFHTLAVRWTAMLDTGFIVLWVWWYLIVTARRMLRWSWGAAAAVLVIHILLSFAVAVAFDSFRASYLPTLAATYAIAVHASRFPLPGARWMWASALVFSLSITMAWIDRPVAEAIPVGTHFLWHLFNATALLLGSIGLARNLGMPELKTEHDA